MDLAARTQLEASFLESRAYGRQILAEPRTQHRKIGLQTDSASWQRSELDPFNAVFQKKLVLRFIEMKDYAQAGAALKRYVDTFPQDSFMRQLLKKAESAPRR